MIIISLRSVIIPKVMKYIYLVVAFAFYASAGMALGLPKFDTTKKDSSGLIYTSVEKAPEFPGGISAFGNFINTNLKYPAVAKMMGVNGRVVVYFVIDSNGKVTDIKPSLSGGADFDAEAVRVIASSPAWSPGIQDGHAVKVCLTIPINFTADEDNATIGELKTSEYGFIFEIKGKIYNITEAAKLIGNEVMADDVISVNPVKDKSKYPMPGKKDVYLVRMKNN